MEFKCGLCRDFVKSEKSYVKTHIANFHSGNDDRVDCNFCGREYKNKREYRRHLQRNRCKKLPNETVSQIKMD
jgi:hypothetical protein